MYLIKGRSRSLSWQKIQSCQLQVLQCWTSETKQNQMKLNATSHWILEMLQMPCQVLLHPRATNLRIKLHLSWGHLPMDGISLLKIWSLIPDISMQDKTSSIASSSRMEVVSILTPSHKLKVSKGPQEIQSNKIELEVRTSRGIKLDRQVVLNIWDFHLNQCTLNTLFTAFIKAPLEFLEIASIQWEASTHNKS